eukprot:Trichotokara_eunicae@DN5639_c0_g1_i7.p1
MTKKVMEVSGTGATKKGSKGVAASKSARKVPQTKSSHAGLVFPVGRVSRLLRDGRYSQRVGDSAAVYMASVLEYLTAELLEVAGENAVSRKKKTIAPKHLVESIRNDEDFVKFLKHVTIAQGGSMTKVGVHPELLKKGGKASGKGAASSVPAEDDSQEY